MVVQLNESIIPPVTVEELRKIRRRIGDNKAPGLYGIPNRALKLAVKTRPDIFNNTSFIAESPGIRRQIMIQISLRPVRFEPRPSVR